MSAPVARNGCRKPDNDTLNNGARNAMARDRCQKTAHLSRWTNPKIVKNCIRMQLHAGFNLHLLSTATALAPLHCCT
ncbi:hypothetical protein EVAR_64509_1 [Eumeta japonica]|uniref:Uncharacterized protein n=1 Tax=Eumeta variegata TaxID=151549 RepID=A0A4C1Z0F1_EUMVA|nr:hypothetical protein EVAR_64509_1 [Eumeta japonica]